MHIDLDVLDKDEFKANQFAAPNGLTLNKLTEIIKAVKQNFKIAAIAFTAFEPGHDSSEKANEVVHKIIDLVLNHI